MNGAVPTIRVRSKETGFECLINQTDFDPEVWEPVDKKQAEAAKEARRVAEAQAKAAADEAAKLEQRAKSANAKGAGKKAAA